MPQIKKKGEEEDLNKLLIKSSSHLKKGKTRNFSSEGKKLQMHRMLLKNIIK